MRNMKNPVRCCAAVAALLIALSFCVVPYMASAVADLLDDAVFDLVSLGILKGDEKEDLHLTSDITRAEFAVIAARLIGVENWSVHKNIFQDVSEQAYYVDAVNNLAALGYMSGDGGGIFRPGDKVTETEICKVLVSVLGYDVMAAELGGYPSGYISAGAAIGLGDAGNFAATRHFTVQKVALALDIDLMEPIYGTDTNYKVISGKTLRDILYNRGDKRVSLKTGIMTATEGIFVSEAVSGIGQNQVEIDGFLYDTDGFADGFIGRRVEFYAETDENGRNGKILGIRKYRDVTELILDAYDISAVDEETISYSDGDRVKKAKISPYAVLVKNGRPISRWSISDLFVGNGTVELIDNDGDKSSDMIFVWEYKSGIAERVSDDILYFQNTASPLDTLSLNVVGQDNRYIEIYDENGEEMLLSQISPGDVITLTESSDKEYYRLYCSKKQLEGIVDLVELVASENTGNGGERETYVIDGQRVLTEPGRFFDGSPGESVVAKLNFRGAVVELSARSENMIYGWIYSTARTGLDSYRLQMLLAGTLSESEKIDDTDPDNIITTPYLKASNSGVAVYDLADKVNVDGRRMSAADFVDDMSRRSDRLITFSCNQDGAVRSIQTPERCGTGDSRYYNSYEKTFGKIGDSVFGTTEDTFVVCVPTNGAKDTRDLCAGVELDENDQIYTVSGYDVDESSHIAKAVVIHAALNADAAENINKDTKTAIAESVSLLFDEKMGERLRVALWCDGSRETYFVADSQKHLPAYGDLREGTVFRYALNVMDEIYEIEIEEMLSEKTPYYEDGVSDLSLQLYGLVENIEYHALSFSKNRYVHKMTVRTGRGEKENEIVDINVRNAPDMYCYRPRAGTVRKLLPEEIEPGTMEVYARIENNEVKALIFVEK